MIEQPPMPDTPQSPDVVNKPGDVVNRSDPAGKAGRTKPAGRSPGAAADRSGAADYLTLDRGGDRQQPLGAAAVPDELDRARQPVAARAARERDRRDGR